MKPLRLPYEPWPEARDHLLARVLHLSLLPIDKGWNAQGVRSSYWRLYVNSRDGAAVVLDGGARHPIDPGRVHLIPAWVPFGCVNDRRVEHLYIHFDLAGLPGPLVRELFAAPVALATASPAHRLAGQLAEALRRNPPDDLATLCFSKALVYASLAELVESLPPAERRRCQRLTLQHSAIAPALRHIESHLAQPLDNPQLAHRCAMSEDHFIRVFRKLIGQTPAQYVLERRVAVAAQKLAYSDAPIERIAQSVGFANRFHFTAAFSRRMGVGPATYRKLPRA